MIVLLTWLIWSGKLDFKQLNILYERPEILVANILLWLMGSLLLGGFRWYLLLKGQGLIISYYQVLRLQLIGFFFNTAIPGAVGGDIIKAIYVIKGLQSDRKTPAMLTILLDRVFGLCALFLLGAAAVISQMSLILSNPLLFPIAAFVFAGSALIILGITWVLFISDKFPIIKNIHIPNFPGSSIFIGVYHAIRVYKSCPRYIFFAILLGIVMQYCAATYAFFLTEALTGNFPNFGSFMAIFTVGVMTTALPLAPGGLGVGHIAFEKLYLLIGLTNGANVFNIMVLVQLLLNLLGLIPYLNFKSLNIPQINENTSF